MSGADDTDPTPIERWLSRRSRLEDRRVTIADALIGGRWAAYNRYRLRFFAVRFVLHAVLHGVNLAILVRIFDRPSGQLLVAGAYAVLGLVRAGWWGVLEGLRERIRALFAEGQGHRADREISRWLGPATRAGAGVVALTLAGFGLHALVAGPDPAVAFLVVAFLMAGVELPLRCYHSGLAAVRRVYRPLGLLVVLDLSGLAALAVLWPLLGEWAAPASALVSGLAVASATFVYTRRLYWFMGLRPGPARPRGVDRSLGLTRREVWSGLASAAMALDATLLVVLWLAGPDASLLATIVVVALPALAAGVDWANLFYFDLTRLGAAPFGQFRAQAAAQVERLAWLVGAGTGLVGMAVVAVAVPDAPATAVVALAPLFVVRSLLAANQVRAFTEHAFERVAASSALVLAVSVPVVFLDSEALVLVLLAAATVPGIVLLRRSDRLGPGPRAGLPWSLAEWLPAVACRRGPTLVLVVHLDSYQHPLDPESAALAAARDQATALAEAHPHAMVTVIGANRIALALTPGGEEEWITREALVGGAAGLITGLDVLSHDDGVAALDALRDRLSAPGEALAESLLDTVGFDDDLAAVFDHTFGELVRTGRIGVPGRTAFTTDLPGIERQEILSAAVHHATYGLPRDGGRHEVTTVCIDGAIVRYYAIPQRVPRRVRIVWRATVIDAWFDVAFRQQQALVGSEG